MYIIHIIYTGVYLMFKSGGKILKPDGHIDS